MTWWVRVDCDFYDHPKFIAAGPLGIAQWLAGLAWCRRNKKNGVIPTAVARRLLDWDGIAWNVWQGDLFGGGEDATADAVSRHLVDVGLWETCAEGFLVHEFVVYQRSAEDVENASLAYRTQRALAGKSRVAGAKRDDKGRLLPQVRTSEPSEPSSTCASDVSSEPSSEPSSLHTVQITDIKGRSDSDLRENAPDSAPASPGFVVPEPLLAQAAKRPNLAGVDIDAETAVFVAHCAEHGTQPNVKGWQGWMRNYDPAKARAPSVNGSVPRAPGARIPETPMPEMQGPPTPEGLAALEALKASVRAEKPQEATT
jgi:hypothetical protein